MKLISDDIDFRAWMEEPKTHRKVRKASDFRQALHDHLFKPRTAPRIVMGWEKTYGKYEFREGELTVWAGPNGQGKSMMTGQVALDLCVQRESVCIASMEMKPVKTLNRMALQAYGGSDMPPSFVDAFAAWTDGKLWMYDQVGSVNPEEMTAVIRYAVMEVGIKHFFIDNLQKVIAKEDDYNGQKVFVDGLHKIAQDHGAHIHLIHHTKKVDREKRPSKEDIKGASSITDLADNVFIVSKNQPKIDVAEGKSRLKGIEADRLMLEPDVFLDLLKQRHGEFEGVFGFWFDSTSLQYLERAGDLPKRYRIEPVRVERPHAETVDIREAF